MKQRSKPPLPDYINKRVIEGVFILIVSLSLFLIAALTTYHQEDPSWSQLTAQPDVFNAGGRVGAWFADFFFFIFGYFAYFFPIMMVYGAWLLLRERHHFEFDYRVFLFRCGGVLLIFLGGCGLASLQLDNLPRMLPYSAGGLFGYFISHGLNTAFNLAGSALLLAALLLAGMTLFTGVSWLKVTEQCGRLFWQGLKATPDCFLRVKRFAAQVQARIKQKRAEKKLTIEHRQAPTLAKPKISTPKPIKSPSKRYAKDAQKQLFNNETVTLPSLTILDPPSKGTKKGYSNAQLESMSREVEQRLSDFGITVKVVSVLPGPVITRFELELAPGVKVSKISALAKDLARSLAVLSVRVVEVIPGKPYVGIELPNQHREVVRLSEVLATEEYASTRTLLTLALGVDISGNPVMVDLCKMPHLLVAGTTGSGKSVGLNAMLLSLLFKLTPEEMRLILVDPKMLELAVYEGIPHLLTPVVTDMKQAANALRWCVAEMERRYRLMAALGVRNISGFNNKVREAIKNKNPISDPLWQATDGMDEEAPLLEPLPFVVVVIDELADMMMVVGKKVEQLIARIAQKARAAGIHLILATQRPSVDVLTGLIKSNIPTRISFQVSSKIDSRTILDQQGADQLLGHGDMLYLAPGTGTPVRVHGAYVQDAEVHKAVKDWRARSEPDYLDEITDGPADGGEFILPGENAGDTEDVDELYDEAVQFVTQTRKASISSVQRKFKIGYNRAARLIEEMERTGIVSPMESNGAREVLVKPPAE